MKHTIIPEIERESANELSPTELEQIDEHLTHVVKKFTEKIEQAEDGTTRKSIRFKRKVLKN